MMASVEMSTVDKASNNVSDVHLGTNESQNQRGKSDPNCLMADAKEMNEEGGGESRKAGNGGHLKETESDDGGNSRNPDEVTNVETKKEGNCNDKESNESNGIEETAGKEGKVEDRFNNIDAKSDYNNIERRESTRSIDQDQTRSRDSTANNESKANKGENGAVIPTTFTEGVDNSSKAERAEDQIKSDSEQDSKDAEQNDEGGLVNPINNEGADKKTSQLSNGSEIGEDTLRQLEEIANSIDFEENASTNSDSIRPPDGSYKGAKRPKEEEEDQGSAKRMRLGDSVNNAGEQETSEQENATASAELTSSSTVAHTEGRFAGTEANDAVENGAASKSKSLSREKLESLVLDLVSETLLSRSELSSLRRRCDAKDQQIETWKEKYSGLKKQLDDLERVLKKYKSDWAKDEKAKPVMLTRSVALQVDIAKQRQVAAKASSSPPMVKKKTALPEIRPRRVASTSEVVASLMTMKRPLLPYPRATHTIAVPLSPVVNGTTPSATIQPVAVKGIKVQQRGTNSDSVVVQVAQGGPPVPQVQQNVTQSSMSSKQMPTTSVAPSNPPSSKPSKDPELVDLCDDDAEVNIVSSSSISSGPSKVSVVNKGQAQVNGNVGSGNTSAPVSARPSLMAGNSKQSTSANSTTVNQDSPSARRVHPSRSPLLMTIKTTGLSPVPASPKPSLPPLPPPATPATANTVGLRPLPPPADLILSLVASGIQLKWNVQGYSDSSMHARIASFEIYALESTQPNGAEVQQDWLHVGDVEAMALPMACTLSQFVSGMKYFFAIRGCDEHGRRTTPSEVKAITLKR